MKNLSLKFSFKYKGSDKKENTILGYLLKEMAGGYLGKTVGLANAWYTAAKGDGRRGITQ